MQIGHGTDTGKKRRRNEDEYVVAPPLFAIADGMGGAQAGELASSLAAGAVREDEGAAGSGERRVAELVRSGKLSPEEAGTHPQRSVITRALGTDPDVDPDTFSIPAQPGDLFMLCSDGLTSMVEDQVILACIEKNRNDLQATAKALIRAANKGGGEDTITVVFFEIGEDTGEPLEQTAQYPVLGEDGEAELDEKTLDEFDRVPALDTMVVSPGEAEQVAKPPQPKRRTRSRIVPALLLILLALAVLAVVLWTLHGR